MNKVIKEERVAKAWVKMGFTPKEAEVELRATDNYVLLDGEATKVYGAKVLAIMHSLAKKPILEESKFSVT